MSPIRDLNGKVALVTGASVGIGRAITLKLNARGAFTHAFGRSDEKLSDLKRQVENSENFDHHLVDLRDVIQIERAVKRIEDAHGGVDILMNFAGVWHDEDRAFYGLPLTEVSPNEIQEVLGVGLSGSLLLTRHVLQNMKLRKRGKIVFVSCGFAGPEEAAGWVHYYTANQAIEAMTRGIAAENRADNIQVNCIAPWFVATEAVKKFFPEKIDVALSAEEVAEKAVSLATDFSNNLSGQIIEVRSSRDH